MPYKDRENRLEQNRRWAKANPERKRELRRISGAKHPKPKQVLLSKEDQARYQARWKVSRAIAAGRLEQLPCEICGDPKSQAHHEDYARPLNVKWLCAVHHAEIHRQA